MSDRVSADPLLRVPPPVYFERLTGLRVGRSGKLRCLFHDDQVPSLHVYSEAGRGWYCFGCGRGGSVYDLAALLWGRTTRGGDFLELRRELEKRLLSPPVPSETKSALADPVGRRSLPVRRARRAGRTDGRRR